MNRKDRFICIVSAAWLVVNAFVYYEFGSEVLFLPNSAFLLTLSALLLSRRFMDWLNR